ncbi:trehalose 6-phosphate phosphatase [Phycicoccus badiiscoriae]|uniref:Trehalose 6-phosphate phosphatase n=1 Tax=Pedococcus badiiscoriae TaxID=642776 RepID=A0A852WD27_9MICO|nr:trehalose-phosphatase [Pedococcus badiiscoriae]NYG07177.1 trehalose 6-phosphate phosphatase [Pedococcus badiiscoriae]
MTQPSSSSSSSSPELSAAAAAAALVAKTWSVALVEAIDEFACAPTVLVASDFDGVLAPLVQDPMASRPLQGTIESLEGLAALPRTYAAVVSGRDLETLTLLTGLAGSRVTRIGSHGAETSASGTPALTDEQRLALGRITDDLKDLCASLPAGPSLEFKPGAVVFHTRRMTDESAAREAEEAALEVTTRHTGLHVLHGKHVVEVSVVQADKGTALVALRDELGADVVAYFGDDVTDEDAFRALGSDDVTVKVGPGATAARFRVDSPEEAAAALRLLFERRSRQ